MDCDSGFFNTWSRINDLYFKYINFNLGDFLISFKTYNSLIVTIE